MSDQTPKTLTTVPSLQISPEPGLPCRKLGVKEAAAFLGLSASTLNKMRVYGTGPCYYKLSRRVLYDVHDLEDWAARHRRVHTSQQS